MRLLLAEDELALSKALTAILERNNYSVDAALLSMLLLCTSCGDADLFDTDKWTNEIKAGSRVFP